MPKVLIWVPKAVKRLHVGIKGYRLEDWGLKNPEPPRVQQEAGSIWTRMVDGIKKAGLQILLNSWSFDDAHLLETLPLGVSSLPPATPSS